MTIESLKRVRLGTPSDEGEIMEMCRMLHAENGLMSMSDGKVRSVLQLAFQERGGVIGVIGDRGSIEAMIFLLIGQLWSSEDYHLEELFSYCRPEFRRSNNAKLLLEFAKESARQLNMELIIGILSDKRTEQKVRLYQRQFGKPRGAFFVWNTKWNENAAA